MKETFKDLDNIYQHCYRIVGGVIILLLFVYLMIDGSKNIKDDIDFINNAKVGKGFINARGYKPGKCDEYGCEDDIDLASYTFTIQGDNKVYEGQSGITNEIFEKVNSDNLPYPVEIEYLPNNPKKNRIVGTGLENFYEILKYYWLGFLGRIIIFIIGINFLFVGARFVNRYPHNPLRPLFFSFGIPLSIPIAFGFTFLLAKFLLFLFPSVFAKSIIAVIGMMLILLSIWGIILYLLSKMRDRHYEKVSEKIEQKI